MIGILISCTDEKETVRCLIDGDCKITQYCDDTDPEFDPVSGEPTGVCTEKAGCRDTMGVCPDGFTCDLTTGLCERSTDTPKDNDAVLPDLSDASDDADLHNDGIVDTVETDLMSDTDDMIADELPADADLVSDEADLLVEDSDALLTETDIVPDLDALCVSDCAIEGVRVCDGVANYRVCVNDNGCLHYGPSTACGGSIACTGAGQCVCTPNCDGKTCGDNGCGGSCGTCPVVKTGNCVGGDSIEFFTGGACDGANCQYTQTTPYCPAWACGDQSVNAYPTGHTCYGTDPIGSLDAATDVGLNGWACDKDTPYKIDVHLYFDGTPGSGTGFVRVVKADQASESPVDVQCGGDTGYRFSYNLSPEDITALGGTGQHVVHAYPINNQFQASNPEMSGSPKTFTLP
ncbi:MAG TPA: hypothetical protein PLV42_03890 [bacterium]|nr:hypothetical protein [bacterium]